MPNFPKYIYTDFKRERGERGRFSLFPRRSGAYNSIIRALGCAEQTPTATVHIYHGRFIVINAHNRTDSADTLS